LCESADRLISAAMIQERVDERNRRAAVDRRELSRMVPLMQAGRIWPSVMAAATLGFLLAATAADARGGRSSGRMRGFVSTPSSTSAVNSTSPASSTSPVNSTSPAAIAAPTQAVEPAAAPTKAKINLSTVGIIAAPPAPPAAAPTPQVAAPISQLGTITPLSDTAAVPTAQVTGGSSGVPLPETPGGGREGLQACMEFWDAATHMTKAEWKAACQRSTYRLQGVSGQKKP
jgi:hypothetical protein